MNKSFQNKIRRIIFTRHFFAFLCVLLFLSSYLLIRENIFVKGDRSIKKTTTVHDGFSVKKIESLYSEPEKILSEGGIEVFPEDIISTEQIIDPLIDGGIGQKIVIDRAPKYYVLVDGKELVVRSRLAVVAEIIKKSQVVVAPKDQLSLPLTASVTPGETIVITRINEVDIDTYEDIEFETINRGDASIPFGQKRVIQSGSSGQRKKTYRVVYKNGVEVRRSLISTTITKEKTNKIVASGVIRGRANFGYYKGMVTSFYKGMKGKYLLVTNLDNGKQVKVLIIGSGPYNGPIMDMGTEPFQAIGGRLSSGYLPNVSVQLVD